MRINKGHKLHVLAGTAVVMNENDPDCKKIITLNESATDLWKAVEGKDFTVDTLADVLVANYDIDRATALADAQEIADKWIAEGIASA